LLQPPAQQEEADAEHLGVMLRRPRELGHACWDNDLANVRRLIMEGVDVDDPDQFASRSAPLSDAAYRGHGQIVQLLLEAGADPRWADEFGETALHRAAANGHETVLRVLIDHNEQSRFKYGIDQRDHAGETPLLFAVRTGGSAAVVKLLLGARADPTVRLPQQADQTVLEVAEATMLTATDDISSAEMVALLRADVRVQRLQDAAEKNQQHLQQHATRNSKNDGPTDYHDVIQAHIMATPDTVYRITTLGEAAVLNDAAAIQRLLSGRADPNNHGHKEARRRFAKAMKKTDFETKRDAAQAMDDARERLMADLELAKDPGQFFDMQGVSGDDLGLCSPLWLAAHHGHAECVKLLLNAKANPAWEDDDGTTALHECARWWGHEDITQMLIDGGAPIDAIDGDGETALMCAAAGGYTATVRVLLCAGADTTLRTSSTRFRCGYGTAMEIAESELKWGVYVLLANPCFSVTEAESRAEATAEARLAGLADGPLQSGTKLRIYPPQDPWPPEPPLMSKLKRDASKEDRASARKEQQKEQQKAKRKRKDSHAAGRICMYKSWQKRSVGANLHGVRFDNPPPGTTSGRNRDSKQAAPNPSAVHKDLGHACQCTKTPESQLQLVTKERGMMQSLLSRSILCGYRRPSRGHFR
jgi:ankyrin repeat protein